MISWLIDMAGLSAIQLKDALRLAQMWNFKGVELQVSGHIKAVLTHEHAELLAA
jgi:hypothetical protein